MLAATLSPELVRPAAAAVTALAVVVALGILLRGLAEGRPLAPTLVAAVGFGLDLLLAAGLLRLAGTQTLRSLALVALVVGLRKLASAGLRQGAAADARRLGAAQR